MTADRRFRAALAIVTVLLFVPGTAPGQSRASTVVGSVLPADGSDPSMAPILTEFFRLDLVLRGIRFVGGGATDPDDVETLYQSAGESSAAYALSAVYQDTGEEIRLSLVLYDAAARKRVSGSTAQGRIDLSLGAVVAQAIDAVLAGLVLAPDPLPLREPGGSGGPGTVESAREEPAVQTVVSPGVEPVVAVVPAPGSAADAVVRRFRSVGVTVGAAPLFVTGETATFAKLGILSTAAFHVRLPVGPGALGIGVLSGFGWLRATGLAAAADVRLVPMAVDALYTPIEDLSFGLSLHLSAGAALMSIATTYAGVLTKALPFALAGMQVGLQILPGLRLEVQACFVAFLEGSLPILAFAPEVLLWLRL